LGIYINGVFYRNWRTEEEKGQVDSFDFLTRNERDREDRKKSLWREREKEIGSSLVFIKKNSNTVFSD
jgi:hypothetical protein